ncbi:SLC13 family permease [Phenylobacterium sp. 58.2.17]|uniref:SLC13 family permease n=1 Tax=Phenylobacterium sp. 58.2.17 TaxID=2969306 RepID=UPI00226408C2|nr:SLC13 family permease [Phenylobacterium sp. 58.2.17]MCX7586679.1 SLC13 family permease [Phenylobacterium sp. 58.2.17]
MTLDQGLAFGLVALTIGAFIWGRFRYDVIAICALLAGVAIGVVPAKSAFDGFSNDITVIIAAALVVSAAFAKSGIVEAALRPLIPRLKTERSQVPVLTAAVTILSTATKNVGALAILMPVALQLSRRTGSSPSRLLMPMAFGAMLGGIVTLVGTAPNIIVSQVREELLGKPFGMYDYAPVGLALAAIGFVFLAFAYRILPKDRAPAVNLEEALAANAYLTEVEAPEDWPLAGLRIGALHDLAGGEARVMMLLSGGRRRPRPHPNTKVRPGDVLLLQGEPQPLDELINRGKLRLTRSDRPVAMEEPTDEVRVVEAVVGGESELIGRSAQQSDLYGRQGVNLLAVSRSGFDLKQRPGRIRLRAGDIIVLQGSERTLPAALAALGLLPLAEREVRLGGIRHVLAPAVILAAAMVLVAFQVVPVAIAFFGAAVAMIVVGALRMREAYAAVDGPLIVLIAAMIPVSEAISTTGGAELIGGWLSSVFRGQSPMIALVSIMAVAMAATPFLNNAATVLIVAPVGASMARQLGLNPDPFLMAVAVGAASDFLTPIGHQCNTLVMGPGGYRFADYPRLGAPLTLLVLVLGAPLIAWFWPLTAG